MTILFALFLLTLLVITAVLLVIKPKLAIMVDKATIT